MTTPTDYNTAPPDYKAALSRTLPPSHPLAARNHPDNPPDPPDPPPKRQVTDTPQPAPSKLRTPDETSTLPAIRHYIQARAVECGMTNAEAAAFFAGAAILGHAREKGCRWWLLHQIRSSLATWQRQERPWEADLAKLDIASLAAARPTRYEPAANPD